MIKTSRHHDADVRVCGNGYDAKAPEAFVTKNEIEVTGRREFRGTKTVCIRDPDRNVLELIGPGPSVAQLIAEHVHSE
ncbi:hypothetical protein [Ruegeria meonggei]|uniref:hypothetical protein n=1 Tax=Ruegeria meonggei TaxID=1446476 RepID=UPI000A26874D|nr:hypothetical protein [Ruegeria meonggei]